MDIKRYSTALLALLFISAVSAPAARAVIYKYVDENGVLHYTDSPGGTKVSRYQDDRKRRRTVRKSTKRRSSRAFNDIIYDKSRKYNIEPSLIRAVIETESGFDPTAVSKRGAKGLMQLMPNTAKSLGVYDPFNPEQNIEGGTKYLKYLLKRFDGDLKLALAAYNAGPAVVEKYRSVPPYSETRRYVKNVLSLYGGKRRVSVKSLSRGETIYKIVQNDGTIIYTNSTHYYGRSTTATRF